MSESNNLMNQVGDIENLKTALELLNPKGSAGMDGITVKKMKTIFPDVIPEISEKLITGEYKPDRMFRMYIPKRQGTNEFRMLSIPTVMDRIIQTSIVQVLNPIFEPDFSKNSFGFIKGRGCFPALQHTLNQANMGKHYVVSIDLRKFFDSVPQDKLMNILRKKIQDEQLLKLIQDYLEARIFELGKGNYVDTKGVPQGGPLSPLLSNIMLNELDQYMEARNISFSRYADDCIVLCRSKKEAIDTFRLLADYIENGLCLDINYRKSAVSDITDIEYLGYSFKNQGNQCYRFDVNDKRFEELKYRLEKVIQTSYRKVETKLFVQKITQITRGWVNYYALADIREKLKRLDMWFETGIKNIHQFEIDVVQREYNMLRYAGVTQHEAYALANIENRLTGIPYVNIKIKTDAYMKYLYRNGYKTSEHYYNLIREKWQIK